MFGKKYFPSPKICAQKVAVNSAVKKKQNSKNKNKIGTFFDFFYFVCERGER
jgi:hypothetical protein